MSELVQEYLKNPKLEDLANQFGMSVVQTVYKLSELGVYQRKFSKTKTKYEYIVEIALKLNISVQNLESLEKADKLALESLAKSL
jgi:hypothetical protein